MDGKSRLNNLIEEMRNKGSLPALNESVVEISRLTKVEDTWAADLAAVIMRDCGLTTNLLVTVNSAYYSPLFPIETVTSAVTFLGFDKVYLLAIGLAIFKHTMESLREKKLLSLYASSYFSGVMAGSLARECNYGNPEEIFVAGLLYRLPMMSLANAFPKRFTRMEELVHVGNRTYNQACLEVFKVKYDDVCSAVTDLYKLPGRVSKLLSRDEDGKDKMNQLIYEGSNLADMLFGNKPGGKQELETAGKRIQPLLNKKKFSVSEFINKACGEDQNMTRFFNLGKDDVEIMVNLLEWGKANPAKIVANIGFGEAVGENEGREEDPESLVGHFLTELTLCRRQGLDINQILMLVQEALYRCLKDAEVFVAFLGKNKDRLVGRFYAGSSLTIKADNFQLDIKRSDSPIIQCLSNQETICWTDGHRSLHLPFIITRHLKFESAVIVPIAIKDQTIGAYFIGRTTKNPFTEREQAWIELIISHVVTGFSQIGALKEEKA